MVNKVMGVIGLLGLVAVAVGIVVESKGTVVGGALTVFVVLTWFGLSF